MALKKGSGLHGRQEFAEFLGNTLERLNQAWRLLSGVEVCSRLCRARINMNLVTRNQDEDRSAAVVPELLVKEAHLLRHYSLHLLEIDERRVFRAQNAVQV